MTDDACTCRKGARCLPCIDRDGLTRAAGPAPGWIFVLEDLEGRWLGVFDDFGRAQDAAERRSSLEAGEFAGYVACLPVAR